MRPKRSTSLCTSVVGFSMKCNWHTPTHVGGNGMYATHSERLNIGIFVCGRSETPCAADRSSQEMPSGGQRRAVEWWMWMGVRGFFTRGQCFLQSGRTLEEAQAKSPSVPAGTQGHVWVVKWAKWDEAVQAAGKPELYRDPLTFAVQSKAKSSALTG